MGGVVGFLVLFFIALLPATDAGAAASTTGKTKNAVRFHHTPIVAGSYLWFSSVFDFCDTPSAPSRAWHFRMTDSKITFRYRKVRYEIPVPDAEVTIDPAAVTATTLFGVDGRWHTVVPAGFSGNVFLTGVPYQAPVDFDGGFVRVSWSGTVTSDVPGASIGWRWGAAVYDTLGSPEQELSVNPVDGDTPAGTPQSFLSHLIAGGTSTCPPQLTGELGRRRCVAPMEVDCTAVDNSVCSLPCTAMCDPVCEPPRCHTQCKEPPPATCDVKCEKPECEIQCSDGVDCSSEDRLCPHCTTVCKTPHCVTHCQAPKPECMAVCEEAQCEWKCSPAAGSGACTSEEIGGIACTAPTWRDDICN
jgi:hypothetical protein